MRTAEIRTALGTMNYARRVHIPFLLPPSLFAVAASVAFAMWPVRRRKNDL